MENLGYKVIYIDTDSAFIDDGGENISALLNKLIDQWAELRFGKKVSIEFDYEGHFEKLLILAKCRYIGYLRNKKGIKKEIKGVEAKRKDSTKFMKRFQEDLIDKILNKEPKKNIIAWIWEKTEELKTEPLVNISFPCSLSKKPDEYESYTKPLQALDNTPKFEKQIGDKFFYIYTLPEYFTDEKKVVEYYREIPGKRAGTTKKEKLTKKALEELCVSPSISKHPDVLVQERLIKKDEKIQKVKKAKDVMAFDEDQFTHIKNIDWEQMTQRNIFMKLETLFKAMGWEEDLKVFEGTVKA
jgi:DNA polymerase elongation subunit (family B)